MKHPALSIIVPVFNVEQYLDDCMKSILSQSFTDFELILVDDGSTDRSGSICNEYARKDKRVKVIRQENKGQSAARNKALDCSVGQYITFVDSDDRIAPGTYTENMNILFQHPEIDFIQFPTYCDQPGTDDRKEKDQRIDGEKEIFKRWWDGSLITFSVWNKIFRNSIFDSVRFPVGQVFEDYYLSVDLVEKTKKVYLSNKGGYLYRYRHGSTSNSEYSLKKNLDLFKAQFRVYLKLLSFDNLKPYRIKAFSRAYRRLIFAKTAERNADIKAVVATIRPYVPIWRDIIVSKSSFKEILWLSTAKLMGISVFVHFFISYQDWKARLMKILR